MFLTEFKKTGLNCMNCLNCYIVEMGGLGSLGGLGSVLVKFKVKWIVITWFLVENRRPLLFVTAGIH